MEDEQLNLLEEQEKVYNIKHRAFLFAKDIVAFIGSQHYDRIHFSIFDQLMRSGTSIGANLVEGRAGSSRKDFLNYYAIALKSSNETKYWLCLIRDTIAIDRNRTIELIQEADEISKIVGAIIVSSKRA